MVTLWNKEQMINKDSELDSLLLYPNKGRFSLSLTSIVLNKMSRRRAGLPYSVIRLL